MYNQFMFSLKKIRDGVYHLKFDNSRELGMTMFRYQEFYESKFDHIREKSFSLAEHMGTYVRDAGDENGDWTYTSDWGGYNMPVENIKQCIDAGIPDFNFYDNFMQGIYGLIKADCSHKKAYLIGTYSDEVSNDEEDEKKIEIARKKSLGYFRHEVTHAMFYLVDEYREKSTEIIENISQELSDELYAALEEQGYPVKTTIDEIQAYVATGEGGFFDLIENQEELDELRVSIRELWREYYPEFYDEDEYV